MNFMKSAVKEMLVWIFYFLIAFILAKLIVTYVGQRTQVSGSSMETTLSNGDNLIVDKVSYHFSAPQRFDIIIFPYSENTQMTYIKRIIGMPGETIQIDKLGNIYINGELLNENYGSDIIKDPGIAENPITLGEDEYFVLGDNRNNSMDSRFSSVGNIKRENIIGNAKLRIYPFSAIKWL